MIPLHFPLGFGLDHHRGRQADSGSDAGNADADLRAITPHPRCGVSGIICDLHPGRISFTRWVHKIVGESDMIFLPYGWLVE